jgi:cation transport regulator ChaB
MPATTRSGKARKADLPSTIARSDAKAQDTYAETLASAEEQYDDEGRAHRTAFASLKRTHEKVGDHWQPKDKGAHGPSDARAAKGGLNRLPGAGGVDANASKAHLLELARKLDVKGRSRMTKPQLVDALQKANTRASAKARSDS